MFTSCCPGWIRFIKSQFPHLVPQLSTAKSPQQMFGAVMKTYFADALQVSPDRIFTISVMPCVAKKGESNMELFYEEYSGHDTDVVLTTRELTRMIRSAHIPPFSLENREFDRLMKEYTGAGVIFGVTGGVMEAALRSAYYLVTGKNPDPDAFQDVRNDGKGVKSAEIRIGDAVVKAAVVSGLGNTRRLLQQIERGKFTMILWKSWPVLAAVSEAAGRSSMMAKSLLTSVDRTSISSTKTHLFASPTRTRTFRSSMQTSWGSHYPTRPICFCTRITRHGKCQDLRNNRF